MKICAVKFKNLNSLKGEFEINFDRSPLADSGLYAITGPTGAGKTTLLDAITVALYNRVPRHGGDVEELMTRHTGECWSEVEFESGSKRYRSKWSLNRARGKAEGAFQQDKMELCLVETGTILSANKKKETLKLVEEITGLDYDQFLRSVLLAQGDFALFLKYDPNKRGELLEQMTGAVVFSQISKFVFEFTKEEKVKLQQLDAVLGQFKSLNEEEIAEKSILKKEVEEQVQLLKIEDEKVRKYIKWFDEAAGLQQEQLELGKQWDTLQEDYQRLAPLLEKLSLHRKAQPYAHVVNQLEKQGTALADWEIKKQKIERDHAHAVDALSKAEEKAKSTSIQLSAAVEEKDKWFPLLDKAIQIKTAIEGKEDALAKLLLERSGEEETKNTLQDTIKGIGDVLAGLKLERVEVEEWLKANAHLQTMEKAEPALIALLADFRNANLQLATVEKQLKAQQLKAKELEITIKELTRKEVTCQQQLAVAEKENREIAADLGKLLNGQSGEDLRLKLNKMPQQLANLTQLHRGAEDYKALSAQMEIQQQKVSADAIELENIAEKGKTTKVQLAEAEAHLQTIEQLLEKEKLLLKYEADRQHLANGEPCPLCGSVHHPFATNTPIPQLAAIQKQVTEQKLKLTELNNALNTQRDAYATLNATIIAAKSQIEQAGEQSREKLNQFEAQKATMQMDVAIGDVDILLNHINKLKEKQQNSESVLHEFDARQKELNAKKESIATLKNELSLCTQSIQQQNEQLDAMRKLIKENEEQFVANQTKSKVLITQINSVVSGFGVSESAEKFSELLPKFQNLKDVYKGKIKQAAAIETNIETQQLKQQHASSQFETVEKRITHFLQQVEEVKKAIDDLKMQMTALVGNKDPEVEKQRLQQEEAAARSVDKLAADALQQANATLIGLTKDLENAGEQFDEISKAIAQLQSQLDKAAMDEGFPSAQALADAILPAPEAMDIDTKEKVLNQRHSSLQALMESNQKAMAAHQQQEAPVGEVDEWKQQLAALTLQVGELNQQLGAISRELQDDAQRKQQHAQQLVEQQQQRQVWRRWENLNNLVGSATGDKYRCFAQGLTLSHLTSLANRHLTQFSPRYALVKKAGDNLELEITDAWQADIARPISTLSGGETFLVSLALALGLSDLASNKVQIKSLFIDEGFGTLDAETLDVAMDALENLREAGKSIGVISHVEAMKERITTQIQVKRVAGGYSEIHIRGY